MTIIVIHSPFLSVYTLHVCAEYKWYMALCECRHERQFTKVMVMWNCEYQRCVLWLQIQLAFILYTVERIIHMSHFEVNKWISNVLSWCIKLCYSAFSYFSVEVRHCSGREMDKTSVFKTVSCKQLSLVSQIGLLINGQSYLELEQHPCYILECSIKLHVKLWYVTAEMFLSIKSSHSSLAANCCLHG